MPESVHEWLVEIYSWLIVAGICAGVLVGWWLYSGRYGKALLPPQRQRAVPWSGFEVLAAVYFVELLWPFVVSYLLQRSGFLDALYGPQPNFATGNPNDPAWKLAARRMGVWVTTAALPFELASILYVMRRFSGTQLYQLGITSSRWWANIATSCLWWLIMVPFVEGVGFLTLWIYQVILQRSPQEHPLIQVLEQAHARPLDWGIISFSVLVAAPILEELLFRGVVQRWACKRQWGAHLVMIAALACAGLQGDPDDRGPIWFTVSTLPAYLFSEVLFWRLIPEPNVARGIVAASILFGAMHTFAWPTPIPLTVLGLGLGLLAYRTQSLIGPVVGHSLFNAMTLIALALA